MSIQKNEKHCENKSENSEKIFFTALYKIENTVDNLIVRDYNKYHWRQLFN